MKTQQNNNITSPFKEYRSQLIDRSYQLCLDVIQALEHIVRKPGWRSISDQLIRSSTSIGANLVEARGSSSRKEFRRFHEISMKSANESRYWFHLLKDGQYLANEYVDPLIQECNELVKMLASSIMKLKQASTGFEL